MADGLLSLSGVASLAPISSMQWLARLWVVAALGASEVAVAAIAGVGGLGLAIIAVATVVFTFAYVLTASPGKRGCDRSVLRPVLAMGASSLVAIGITGGRASPFLPVLAAPIVIAWTLARPRSSDGAVASAAVALALVIVDVVVADRVASPDFSEFGLALLGGWTALLSLWMIGRRIALFVELFQSQAQCLARVREGALTDAASHRRGMESMTTKLAHELKNPLAAIKSLVQVELREPKDDKSRRRLDVVMTEVERVGTILREYLDYARPMQEARVESLQLDELMTDVAHLLYGRAEAAGIELKVEGEGGALHADQRLLKEALVNLISNAIEATPRGGSVSATYHLDDEGARIVICDSGRGMSKEVATRVGTPFFTTREGGTGLGVVIARTAIAQHNGKLEYASTPGIGTIATVALPLDPRTNKRVTA